MSKTNQINNQLNELSNQVIGTFCNIASPFVNEVCSNLGQENMFDQNNSNKIYPQAEIKKDDTQLKFLIFLPGVTKDKIKLKISGSKLKLDAITNLKNDIWNDINERHYTRDFEIPCNLNSSNLDVKYENGILYINIDLINNIEEINVN